VWYTLAASPKPYPYFGEIKLIPLSVTQTFYTVILCQTSYTIIYLINVAIDRTLNLFRVRKLDTFKSTSK
jgi:hypothetical protein